MKFSFCLEICILHLQFKGLCILNNCNIKNNLNNRYHLKLVDILFV